MKTILVLLLITFLLTPSTVFAKGGGGGRSSGRSSGSSSGSRSSVSAPKSTNTAPKQSAPKTPSKPSTNKPSATTEKVTNTTTKNVNGKTYSKTGNKVGGDYKPQFRGGYTPPAGSTVYYRDNSFLDYFFLYYILTHGSHREAVVQEPDQKDANGNVIKKGEEKEVKDEGVDGMYVFNWVVMIIVLFGIGYLIVRYVNKRTQ